MKTIEVREPGLLTTVQDLGREGFAPIAVSRSGAADPVALRLGNRLVGNSEGAAALEITLLGGAFVFPQGAVVSLTGSDFGAHLEHKPVPVATSFEVRPAQSLRTGPTRSGARCYLCVQGGINVPRLLGSASTHLLSGLGGFHGRALIKGDVLQIGESSGSFRQRSIAPAVLRKLYPDHRVIRVTPGPQANWFSDASTQLFYESIYRLGEQSNRMGLRLEGATVTQIEAQPMITEGLSLGAIQIPPAGSPILLFVDQTTTGGYPKIANVICADLHRVGQLRPRDEIRFERVTFEAARTLLIEQESLLSSAEAIIE